MARLIDELSVFLPAFNEEANIKDTVLRTKSVLEKVADNWELIVVNDGSSDGTKEIVDELSQKDSRIKVISHLTNLGYGAALKTGIYSCQYRWISFTDSDGQFDFSEIDKFIKKQKETEADLVIGYYLKRQVPLYRKINSFLWQVFVFLLFGLGVRDVDCGFKLFSKKVVDTIPKLESERGAFISSEFLIKARKKGFKIVEIGVHHFPAKKTGTGANLKVIFGSFVDLFKLWKRLG